MQVKIFNEIINRPMNIKINKIVASCFIVMLSLLTWQTVGAQNYCIPAAVNNWGGINDFTTTNGVTNISNLNSGYSAGGYGNFTTIGGVSQIQGGNVDFDMQWTDVDTYGSRIWVDWDHNGIFDPVTEVAFQSSGYVGSQQGTITVPLTATVGPTRMRIVNHWLSSTGSVDPCATGHTYGEFEDYTFTVLGAPPPPAGDTTPCTIVCPGDIYTTLGGGECSAFIHYNVFAQGGCTPFLPFNLTQNVGSASLSDGIDCSSAFGGTTGGSHWRAYAAQTQSFNLNAVEVGFYNQGYGTNLHCQIFVYSYTGTIGASTLNTAQMTLIGQSANETFTTFGKKTINLTTPVSIPAGTKFVVEQRRPAGDSPWSTGCSFSGQTGISYISTSPADCGLGNNIPTNYASLGIGSYHLIQRLIGEIPGTTIVQTSGLESGSEFPIGTTENCFTLYDENGEEIDNCCFNVVVNAYPNPVTSMVCNDLVHVSVDPESCTATINADMILEGGPYGCYDNYTVALGTSMAGPFNLGNTVTCNNIGQTLAVQVTAPNGNRCWGWVLVEDKIPPTIDCDGCVQETGTIAGTLDWTDPTSTGFNGSCYNFGAGSAIAGTHPYELTAFTVPVTGAYTFSLVSQGPVIGGQGYLMVYSPEFVVNSPCDNVVGGMDEFIQTSVTLNLTAGTSYEMVVIDWGTTVNNIFDYTVTVNGPGGVGILASVPCEIACSDIDALLNAKTIADLTALGVETSQPTATDNCALQGCPDMTYTFTVGALSSTELCEEGRYIPITWTVTDLGGNKASCTENIAINLPTLDDVVFPDWVDLECGSGTEPDDLDGIVNTEAADGNTVDEDWPAVKGRDISNNSQYCNLVSQYTDEVSYTCGPYSGAKKIVRRWTVVDCCKNEIREAVQIIKVRDRVAPTVNAGADYTVNASAYACSIWGITLPAAQWNEACTAPEGMSWKVYVDGVLVLNTNGGVVNSTFEFGVGQHTVRYEAKDACGNVGYDEVIITVVDTTPPNVICKEFLQVTVNPNGCINLIPANRFDNGTWDNCCSDDQLVFKVRRMSEPNDTYFRDTIAVGVYKNRVMYNNGTPLFGNVNNSRESHDDLTGVVTGPYGEKFCGRIDVIMRAYCAGTPQLYSDCMVQVFVDDKTRPVITAPANVIVHCEDDPLNNNQPPHLVYNQYFGNASWYDACGSLTVDSTITGTLDDCGEGVLVKTWRVTDKCGNQDVKSQTVTVRHISDFIVTFPADTMITACVDTQDFTPTPHDPIWWPRFNRNDCEQLATTWWDERFYGENDACFKIVRHWKVINWCAFDVDRGNTYDDYSYRSWRLPQTCKWRPSSINQFTANDCNLWRPDIYRRIQDGEYYRALDPTAVAGAAYDKNYRGDGVVEYIQVIKVKDNENPIVQVINPKACPQFGAPVEEDSYSNIPSNTATTPWVYNVLGTLYNGICSAPSATLKASAIDCSNKLNYHYEVDAFANPNGPKSVDYYGLTATINDVLPMGLHRVYWTVSDNCGNVASGNYWVQLRDCKKPSPVCFNGLATVVMPAAGMITLPARYFNHKSFDNCTPASELRFSYSADVNDTLHTWTCDDLVANGSPIFEVTMYVTDGDGNQDFCNTFIRVDDNEGVCGDGGGTNTITGAVTTYAPSEGIKDVVITYAATPRFITNDATGKYDFKANNTDEQKLEGQHDKDYLNGVNVGDIIKIQNHILGKTQLDQPYKMIAADVNMDGNVKVSDIVEIRKLILGKTDKFAVGKSWRTFDANYALSMSNWANTPDYVMVTPQAGQTVVNLNGVKLGDVDLNAKANFTSGAIEQRTVGTLNFRADDVRMTAGQEVEVAVKAKDFKNIAGYQFTFAFDQNAADFVTMKSGAIAISAENFNAERASNGIVTTAVNVDEPMTVSDDEVLFTLVFNAKSDAQISSILTANSSLTPAMGVNGNDEVMDVALEFNTNAGVITAGGFDLKQNTPNPFSTLTAIEFNLPQASSATLTIYDVTGKVVYTKQIAGVKGMNKEVISKTQIGSTGVMFYQLVSGDYSATKKMIILD